MVDSGVLCLAHAGVEDDDESFTRIGSEVAERLRSAGFSVDWDGDPNRRIEVTGLRWQKRRIRRRRRR